MIAFDNATSNAVVSVIGNSSFSFTVGTGSGRFLVAVVVSTADDVSAVTYAAVALTKIGASVQNPSNLAWLSLWYLAQPSSGSNTLSITCPSTNWADCASWSGVRPVAPEASASGTTMSLTVATVADSSWAIIGIAANTAPVSGGAGTTARSANGGGFIIGDNNGPKTPPGNVTLAIDTGAAFSGWIISVAPATTSMLMVF